MRWPSRKSSPSRPRATMRRPPAAAQGDVSGGGAVFNLGTLTVSAVTFRDNASNGAATYGGAIHNEGALLVRDSTFLHNSGTGVPDASSGGFSTGYGGAIASR